MKIVKIYILINKTPLALLLVGVAKIKAMKSSDISHPVLRGYFMENTFKQGQKVRNRYGKILTVKEQVMNHVSVLEEQDFYHYTNLFLVEENRDNV